MITRSSQNVISPFTSDSSLNRASEAFSHAVSAYHLGNYNEALADLAALTSSPEYTSLETCEIWNLRGLVHLANGAIPEAQGCAEQLSAIATESDSARWLGLAEILLSTINQELGHATYALDLAQRGKSRLESSGTSLDIARATYQLGAVHVVRGELQEGRKELELATALAHFAGDALTEGLAQSRLGFCLVSSGNYRDAEKAYELAADLFASIGSQWRRDRVNFGLCVVRMTCGDLAKAEETICELETAIQLRNDPWREGRIKQLRGWLYVERHSGKNALDELQAALGLFRSLKAQRDEAICHEYIGDALQLTGENTEALASYDSAITIGRMVSPTADVVVEALRKSAELLASEGSLAKSLTRIRTAGKLSRKFADPLERAAIRRARGIVKIRRSRTEVGIELLKSSWAAFVQIGASGEASKTFTAIAAVLESRGRLPVVGSVENHDDLGSIRSQKRLNVKAALQQQAGVEGIISQDSRVLRSFSIVLRAAPFDLPILILGETGSGKELFASAAHRHAKRKGPLLAINCAALPSEILDAELFGHSRGAYTGAYRDRPGLIEAASDGTLFLDEIGEMTLNVQGRLLRAIEAHEVRRLGENHPRRVNTRFVGATHRDLESMVRDGGFRADLFFRLRGAVVTLPPLRERPADILLLADHFLAGARTLLGRDVELSAAARERLRAHPWPGNVRELKNVIECSAALCESGSVITPDDLGLERIRVAGSLEEHLEDEERRHLTTTLESVDWNRSKAARLLRLKRTTLLGKLKRLGIEVPRKR